MEYSNLVSRGVRHGAARSILAAMTLAGLVLMPAVSRAQQQPAQPAQQEQKAGKPEEKPQNSWVKLCQDKETVKDGVVEKVKICLTHHERLSAVNGMVLVSAAVRDISGQKNEQLMVLVPLGVALPPGIQLIIDDNKPIPLRFTFCHVGGCTAEATASKEIVDSFKKGKQLRVLVLNNQGKTVVFPVPLKGFTKAYEGPPVDTKKYQEARRKLMQLIRKRQLELAKKAKENAEKKEGAQAPAPKKTQ